MQKKRELSIDLLASIATYDKQIDIISLHLHNISFS